MNKTNQKKKKQKQKTAGSGEQHFQFSRFTLCLLLLVILLTSFSKKSWQHFPQHTSLERMKNKILWFKTKETSICSAGETSGLGWVCGGAVEFACGECAGCEWPSRGPDKDTHYFS